MRRGGPVSGGLTEEELELAAAGQVHSPVLRSLDPTGRASTTDSADNDDVASRRERRKMSLRLDSDVDLTSQQQAQDPALQSASTARSNFSLPRVGEDALGEDDDEDALRTPTTENPSRHHASGDPFSVTSQLSLASTGTTGSANDHQTTPRHTRGGSVFIENLPPLPKSPAEERDRPPLNPFASPHTSPDKSFSSPRHGSFMHGSTALRPIRSSSSFASRDPDNPFIDVVVTSPSPAKPSASSFRSGPGSVSHQSFVSLPSPPHSPTRGARYSLADPYSAGISTMSGSYRPPSPAFSASSNPASPLQGGGSGPRRRRSYDPRAEESADYDGRLRRRDLQRDRSQSRQPEAEQQVGWLSWLFCGCLRPENEDGANDREEVLEQRGRTNPME